MDLARALPFAEGVAVADSALRDKTTTRGELETVLARCVRSPGIQRARQVVAFADPLAESVLGSISRVAFHDHGLPPPELQVWVGDEDEIAGRVDFLGGSTARLPRLTGLSSTPAGQGAGAAEPRCPAARSDFEVVHFTWPEITKVPGQVVDAIRAAFRRGGGTRRDETIS